MRKTTKTIISFAVVLIAGLNLIVPAFAQDPFTAIAVGGLTGASGAGLFGSMASMSGIDIAWSGATADPMDAMWNVLNPDHVYFTGEKHEATNIGEDIYDYIQVDIGDWLQAQSDFIVEFAQAHNVQDYDSGTITGVKSFNGIPLNETFRSQTVSGVLDTAVLNASPGNKIDLYGAGVHIEYTVDGYSWGYPYGTRKTYYNGSLIQTYGIGSYGGGGPFTFQLRLQDLGSSVGAFTYITESTNLSQTTDLALAPSQPETVSWSSDEVNTNVFDGWESAKVKIPKSISQLQPGWTPVDFFNELDRIWSGAGEDNIIIEDGAYVPPVPPVPIPDTPLGDVPFDDWVDLWGQGIYQQLENQSDALDFIGSKGTDAIEELESIDENIGALEETAESIDTNIGIGNGLLGGIKSLVESAVDYLEGIAEHVGELVEEIVEGTETLIAGILNQIPQVFSVIFGPIKQASSIWHYVVEWIQSIGAPLQFIWAMASGTSYNIVLPVYASLAAAVVLAFYKRFGK